MPEINKLGIQFFKISRIHTYALITYLLAPPAFFPFKITITKWKMQPFNIKVQNIRICNMIINIRYK